MSDKRRQPQPGDILDGTYRIDRVLGYGGVGVVCAAWHLHVQRPCAVKFLHPQFVGNPELRARFRREAQSAFQLGHPHIVAITDFRDDPMGWPYIVMELVVGETLRNRLERGALPPRLAVRLMIELCDALHTAHRRGVIHRDLKPENLFLTKPQQGQSDDGTPTDDTAFLKVLDFGLSKILDESDITETGRLLGSPSYMSPEQARGDSHLVDARSDIFAVGALLYECLTAYKLFEADNFEQKRQMIMAAKLPPLKFVQRGFPPQLEEVVLGCCRLAPEDRFENALAVSDALSAIYPEESPDRPRRTTLPPMPVVVPIVVPGLISDLLGEPGHEETLPASGPLIPTQRRDSTGVRKVEGRNTPLAVQRTPAVPLSAESTPQSAKSDAAHGTRERSDDRGEVVPDLTSGSSFGLRRMAAAVLLLLLVGFGGTVLFRQLGQSQGGSALTKGDPQVPPQHRPSPTTKPASQEGTSGTRQNKPSTAPGKKDRDKDQAQPQKEDPVVPVGQDKDPPKEPDKVPDKAAAPLEQLTMAAINPVMMSANAGISRCFPSPAEVPRRLQVDLMISPNGRVREATSDVVDEKQSGCVVDRLLKLRFPAFSGADLSVHYEFVK